VGGRAEALARFLQAYSVLARLPQPRLSPVEVGTMVRRVAALETRVPVRVASGPEITLPADADQLEQLLINLVRNAADAVKETGGRVTLGWRAARGEVALTVDDEGPGLPEASNLFVPFFTPKPHGSGIGLVLCRQIAEAHGGTVKLEPRPGGIGARATVTLPR
jgi:signal transduction histidine kinase